MSLDQRIPRAGGLTHRPGQAALRGRIGFEIELLAPRGLSRSDLAREVARRHHGSVRTIFHLDSEPSLTPGIECFQHLTPGFAVDGPGGRLLCTMVDDITLRSGLDPQARSRPGWYRILSDDPRLMRLAGLHCDPAAPLTSVLDPLARVFGVRAQHVAGTIRLGDEAGAIIAVATGMPGERERPCEVITPPLENDHLEALEALLAPARDLDFRVPAEAAVHLHLDGAPLRTVPTLCNVVRLFAHWREQLWEVLETNPRCRRVAPLPTELVALVEDPATLSLSWPELARRVRQIGPGKFADVNLTQLVSLNPIRDTLEVRILGGTRYGADIVAGALLVERLLDRCRQDRPLPDPSVDLGRLLYYGA